MHQKLPAPGLVRYRANALHATAVSVLASVTSRASKPSLEICVNWSVLSVMPYKMALASINVLHLASWLELGSAKRLTAQLMVGICCKTSRMQLGPTAHKDSTAPPPAESHAKMGTLLEVLFLAFMEASVRCLRASQMVEKQMCCGSL